MNRGGSAGPNIAKKKIISALKDRPEEFTQNTAQGVKISYERAIMRNGCGGEAEGAPSKRRLKRQDYGKW